MTILYLTARIIYIYIYIHGLQRYGIIIIFRLSAGKTTNVMDTPTRKMMQNHAVYWIVLTPLKITLGGLCLNVIVAT